MPDDTECSPHGWTLDTLETHLSSQIQALKESAAAATKSADRAIEKSDAAIEKRLDALNEIRNILNDTITKTLSRDEYLARHEELSRRFTELATRVIHNESVARGKQEGMTTLSATFITGISTLAILISAAAAIITLFHGH